MSLTPHYVAGHGLLTGRSVLITAAAGAGIGFAARYCLQDWPGVVPILPDLPIPPMPCWLVVHREIRGNPVVRRVYDTLAQALPPLLAAGA